MKPNTDVFSDDFEQKIESHLLETHSKQLTISYEADQGDSVVPTDDVRAVSEAALENGKVEVRGRDATGAVKRSTDKFPEQIQGKYDPDKKPERDALWELIASQHRG